MSSLLGDSLRKSGGLLPVWVMLLLLAATEVCTHIGPVRETVFELTDPLWLGRSATSNPEEFLAYHQDVEDEPTNDALLRAIARDDRRVKVLVFGDSTVWGIQRPPAFHQLIKPALVRGFGHDDVGVYSLAMVAEHHVAGFYLAKAAIDRVSPDLIVYNANSFFMGKHYSSRIRRDLGFFNDEFFSESERRAHDRLLAENQPVKNQKVSSFALGNFGYRLLYGAGLRRLLLPPAKLALGSQCYRVDCQDTELTYWRDKLADPDWAGSKDLENLSEFTVDERSLNFTYLMLTAELAGDKGVPIVMLIPPKNLELLESLGLKDENARAAAGLRAAFEERDIQYIDCHGAVDESLFADHHHFLPGGHRAWARCLDGRLERTALGISASRR